MAAPLTTVSEQRAPLSARAVIDRAMAGECLSADDAVALIECDDLDLLLEAAGELRDRAKGRDVTYSPKVFLPVTNLCRDRCTYCTFRKDPWDPDAWTMMPDEITDWSRRGRELGMHRGADVPGRQARGRLQGISRDAQVARGAHHDRVRVQGLRAGPGRGSAAPHQRRRDEPATRWKCCGRSTPAWA